MIQDQTYDCDAIVIGAGVVGLAVARELALQGQSVMVLEQHSAIGTEISARNSEVVHAGLYYPTGSLKARFCVQGNALLHDYAATKGFALRDVGKLIVASDSQQLQGLETLYQQAQINGVPGVQRLTGAQAQALEPELRCVAALHSASTGIVDSHAYMLALQGDLEAAGGLVVCRAQVRQGELLTQGASLLVDTPDGSITLRAATVVNCAGLYATQFARQLKGFAREHIPTAYYAKGSYFSLQAQSCVASPLASPFKRLIYPMPPAQKALSATQLSSLGIHLTLDLAGQIRFGPDIEWLACDCANGIDYRVNQARAALFYEAIRQYWPGLPDGALQADYSGVRPKISPPGAAAADFVLSMPAQHGAAGMVHLFGIESPGLTASLAIAKHLATALR